MRLNQYQIKESRVEHDAKMVDIQHLSNFQLGGQERVTLQMLTDRLWPQSIMNKKQRKIRKIKNVNKANEKRWRRWEENKKCSDAFTTKIGTSTPKTKNHTSTPHIITPHHHWHPTIPHHTPPRHGGWGYQYESPSAHQGEPGRQPCCSARPAKSCRHHPVHNCRTGKMKNEMEK